MWEKSRMHVRVESRASVTDDSLVPLLLNLDRLGLHIGSVMSKLKQLLLHVLEVLGLLNRGQRGVGRRRVVYQEDRGLLCRLRREVNKDIL